MGSTVDSKNVSVGKPAMGGAVFRAPIGTKLPITATETLNVAFKGLGYVSEDGVTNANSPSGDKTKAWGGDTVLNYTTDKPDTFKFMLLEALNIEVLKTVYGDKNVSGELTTGITVKANSEDPKEYVWVFDILLKNGAAKRIVIPSASLTAVEDIVYKDNTPIGYGITISATPDTSGNTHYEYIVKSA